MMYRLETIRNDRFGSVFARMFVSTLIQRSPSSLRLPFPPSDGTDPLLGGHRRVPGDGAGTGGGRP